MAEEDAIALVVIGSGATTQEEVDDLLNDKYGDADVGLVVPADKALYSKSVVNVVSWYNDDDSVIPIQTEGASLTRASAALGGDEGTVKVDYFPDFLNPKDLEAFTEVHVLMAVPEDPDDDEVDLLADVFEAATAAGFKVMDLTKGLDDVRLEDDEPAPEPEPEPEPEEEKPAPKRRSRAKKAETVTPEADPVVTEALADIKEEAEADDKEESEISVVDAWNVFGLCVGYLEAEDHANAFANMQKGGTVFRPLTVAARKAWDSLPGKAAEPVSVPETAQEGPSEPAEEAKEDKPRRGRGRPRTNFEEKQVYDEDTEEWVKRPPGRVAKGTKTRTVNTESGEVIEEGTV